MPEQPINPTFSWLFENNPIGDAIRAEIESKVAIATAEKDKQIAELNAEVEKQKALNSQVLLEIAKIKGGNANV